MSAQSPQRRARGRPRSAPEAQAPTVQALDRGIQLLSALARDGRATLTEVSDRVGMPPSSAHRLLATLQAHALVEFSETTQDWTIGVEAFRIGSAFVQRGNLIDLSRDVMRALVNDTGETANIAIPDDGEVVFMSQVDTQNPIRAFFRPGARVPMHSSGIGKALLAWMDPRAVEQILLRRGMAGWTEKTLTTPGALSADLEATRARGYAFDDEERHTGMRCIAAPIFNPFGEVVAGISISGPTARISDAAVERLGARVRAAAEAVTEMTGGLAPASD
ncbi:MAG: HTH-type transcriptional regulator BhcR [Pseudomonadota bacterium]